MHEVLGPSATSALGAAYDRTVQFFEFEHGDEHTLLRYSLACHLVRQLFAVNKTPTSSGNALPPT
jgi:hypothetical protein